MIRKREKFCKDPVSTIVFERACRELWIWNSSSRTKVTRILYSHIFSLFDTGSLRKGWDLGWGRSFLLSQLLKWLISEGSLLIAHLSIHQSLPIMLLRSTSSHAFWSNSTGFCWVVSLSGVKHKGTMVGKK